MHTLEQLEKQQVGLRLPKYLVDDIDNFTKVFALNRTDVIVEAIKSYITEQKAQVFYSEFDKAAKELKSAMKSSNFETLNALIDDLEHS